MLAFRAGKYVREHDGRMVYCKAKIGISASARVLVVEDSERRIEQFLEWLPTAEVVRNVGDAEKAIINGGVPDVVFLDHDLEIPAHQSGLDVAELLRWRGHEGIGVFIHSANEVGARNIQLVLPKSRLQPFGSFDIELI